MQPPTELESREIEAIFKNFNGEKNLKDIYQIIDSQLNVIHQRAQSLIGLSGVVITVTGFSGRIIADTNIVAQILIILGISLVGLAAAITMHYVFPIRWITSYMDCEPREWLLTAIRRRTRKSNGLRLAMYIMILGMIFYLTSVALMLLFPEANSISAR